MFLLRKTDVWVEITMCFCLVANRPDRQLAVQVRHQHDGQHCSNTCGRYICIYSDLSSTHCMHDTVSFVALCYSNPESAKEQERYFKIWGFLFQRWDENVILKKVACCIFTWIKLEYTHYNTNVSKTFMLQFKNVELVHV